MQADGAPAARRPALSRCEPVSPVTPIHVVLGTAGHIDHGKTTLVKSLTGVDTDRLPEEKRRGITIVLGFAPLDLPDGTRIGVVDVPGHERFVKTMVAGAGGIDLVLLVVAADEGVMPQTREHLEICQLLGIQRGIVALTKIDRASPDLSELALEDVRAHLAGTRLEGAPIIPVSALTGEGLDRLRAAIQEAARAAPKRSEAAMVLPIDRLFQVKGFGSVVTGTMLSGTVALGDTVEVLPPVPGRPTPPVVRVRSVEVFHQKVERAIAGDRTALALAGVELEQLAAGQIVVAPGAARPTRVLDVELEYLKSRPKALKTGAKALFHLGTAQVEAGITLLDQDRLEPGQRGFARLRLRTPVAALPGQRFIVRGFDTVAQAGRTIGGGLILDPEPVRRRRHTEATHAVLSTLQVLDEERAAEPAAAGPALDAALVALVEERGPRGADRASLARRLGERPEAIGRAIARASRAGAVVALEALVVAKSALAALEGKVLELIAAFHREHPYKRGMSLGELVSRVGRAVPAPVTERAANALVGMKRLLLEPEGYRRPEHSAFAAQSEGARAKVAATLDAAGLEPPALEVLEQESGLAPKDLKELLAALTRAGDVIRAAPTIYFGRRAFEAARDQILGQIAKDGEISTAKAKELTGVSRKYLIPLLEALDKAQVTVRVGEVRKARRGP
jgi:selenocysteine-specific elongation factor